MAGLSTKFGFGLGLEEGLLQQLLTLSETEALATQPGSNNLGHQPCDPLSSPAQLQIMQNESQLPIGSGARPLEVPSPSTDILYRPFLAHLLQAHGGPSQTVPSQYFDSSIADFCSTSIESMKEVPGAWDPEAEDKAEKRGSVDAGQQRARYIGGVSTHAHNLAAHHERQS